MDTKPAVAIHANGSSGGTDSALSPGAVRKPNARVLVVDDDEPSRMLSRQTLEDEDYEVTEAGGGVAAIRSFQTRRPDCVLLDVRIPDIDGFETYARMRALPQGAETPILFLTALRDAETAERALRAGADDFLTKPVRPSEIVIRVQSAIRLRRLSDELLRQRQLTEHLLAFVLHDLKKPFDATSLRSQLLLRDTELRAPARGSAAQVRAETVQLKRSFRNLLDLALSDQAPLTLALADVDLRALVDGVFDELGPDARQRGLILRSSLDIKRIRADEDLLRRTLTNLVENAICHAPRQTSVEVRTAARGNETELRVLDAGRRLGPETRDPVFDAFAEAGASAEFTDARAQGLSLSFCKLAVEAHGGRIWVEDGAPGAVFCVRLPVSAAANG